MPDVLEKILDTRREALARQKRAVSLREVEAAIQSRPPALSFADAIRVPGQISIIAEMKRKSPSAGEIRPTFNPTSIATAYRRGGARAISVLTESNHFGGSLADLAQAKKAEPEMPMLRKDFLFDPYQMAEARATGADAALLIADMLEPAQIKDLVQAARAYGIEPLVELFTPSLLETVLDSGANVIGINTRNLRTLEMAPNRIQDLGSQVPKDRILVAESGIRTADDVKRLRAMGFVSAVLVGESLLKQENLEKAVRLLSAAGEK